MADLRALVEGLGHTDVATHIQSGNVVFRASSRSAERVAVGIEEALARDLGFETAVMVRTAADLSGVLAARPFPDADPAALHVAFCRREPDPERAAALTAPAGSPDECTLIGREVHLHLPSGMGRTKLNGAGLERRLGVPVTARNWRVVTALQGLAALSA
jgi:uncharacterized protein (DUF1697 family)